MVSNIIVGHSSFYLRMGWIKKGIDYLDEDNTENAFSKNNIEAVDKLGIGSVMVQSLKFWLEVLEIIKKEKKEYILIRNIKKILELDPYLQNKNILWLLHSYILEREDKNKVVTLWEFVFNNKININFDEEELITAFKIYLDEKGINISERSLKDTINVFIKTYNSSKKNINDPEENILSPFLKLNYLIKNEGKYYFRDIEEKEISEYLVLYLLNKKSNFLKMNEINLVDAYSHFNSIIRMKFYNYDKLINKLEKREIISLDRAAGLAIIHMKKILKDEEIIERMVESE